MLVGQIPKRYKSGPQLDQKGNQLMGVGRRAKAQKGGLELFRNLIWDTVDPSMDIGSPDIYGDGRRGRKPVRLSPQQGGLYLLPGFFSDGPGQYSDKAIALMSKDPSKGGKKRKSKKSKSKK